ncbi:MAG: DNA-3-methyladenine glycosylase I [Acidiferrobacterales bacterium]
MRKRCQWATDSELMITYHDREWGVPVHDDRQLFEFLVLEGAQAGLSWSTILSKRQGYVKAYDNFDPGKVARYGQPKVRELLANSAIVRNRSKVLASIENAKAFLQVQNEFGSFDNYVWQFVDGTPKQNAWRSGRTVPARSRESEAMSKDLRKRGFKFVGATICYAFMQAVGMVNDHTVECFRYRKLAK